MNLVVTSGKLTHDIEVKQNGDFVTANFQISVKHPYKGEYFYPRFSAIGKTAEFLGQYGKKGTIIEVTGYIRTVTKEVEGKNVTTMYLEADKVNFGASDKKDDAPADASAVAEKPAAPKVAPKTTTRTKTTATKTTAQKAAPAPKTEEEYPEIEGDQEALPF